MLTFRNISILKEKLYDFILYNLSHLSTITFFSIGIPLILKDVDFRISSEILKKKFSFLLLLCSIIIIIKHHSLSALVLITLNNNNNNNNNINMH